MQALHWNKNWLGKLLLSTLIVWAGSAGLAYSAPKTILVLGDSLSAEYGLARGTGWVALLEQRLHEKNMVEQIINASISGETSSGGADRIVNLLKKYQPAVVIVELGGNDGLRGLPITAAEQNFRNIIAACHTAKSKVLLVGMQIPPNYGRSYTDKFTAMYGEIARQSQVALVPFLLDGVADKPELFQADHIHLIAAAHPRILENVWPKLLPLLSGQ